MISFMLPSDSQPEFFETGWFLVPFAGLDVPHWFIPGRCVDLPDPCDFAQIPIKKGKK